MAILRLSWLARGEKKKKESIFQQLIQTDSFWYIYAPSFCTIAMSNKNEIYHSLMSA